MFSFTDSHKFKYEKFIHALRLRLGLLNKQLSATRVRQCYNYHYEHVLQIVKSCEEKVKLKQSKLIGPICSSSLSSSSSSSSSLKTTISIESDQLKEQLKNIEHYKNALIYKKICNCFFT